MAAKDIEAGRAHVLIALRDRVTAGLKRVQQTFSKWGKSFLAAGGALTGAGTAVLAPLLAAATAFASAGDQVHKMSIRTQASAEFLSEMKFAAEQSGTSIDQLGSAMFRANRRIANAATGTGPAVRALKELGISAGEFNKLPTEDKFLQLADAISSMDDQSRAAQLGFEIFGDNFRQLQPLINEGSAGIAKLRGEARALGLQVSTEDAAAAAALGDAYNRATKAISAAWFKIGAAIAPIVTELATRISHVVAAVSSWIDRNRGLFVAVAAIAAGVAAFGTALSVVGIVLIGVAAAISSIISIASFAAGLLATIGTVLATVFSPMGLAIAVGIAALVGFGVAAWYFRDQIASALASVAEFFRPVTDAIGRVWAIFSETFGGIVTALGSGQLAAAANIAWLGFIAAAWQGVAEFGGAISAALDFLGTIFPGVDSIRDYVTEAFSGIAKAILAGRWDIAASLLMAKMRLAIAVGWGKISNIWAATMTGLGTMWDFTVWGLRSAWNGVVTALKLSVFSITSIFGTLLDGLDRLWTSFRVAVSNFQSLLGSDSAEGAAKRIRDEQVARSKARKEARDQQLKDILVGAGREGFRINADLSDSVSGRVKAEQRTNARNRERQAELRKQIAALEQEANQAHADAGSPEVRDVAADARRRLKQAIAKAEEAAKKGRKTPEVKGVQAQAAGANAAATKISSAGTFSAAGAAQALGIDTRPAQETAKNTKRIASLIEKQQPRPLVGA